jgi:hypothetical protein
VIRAVLDRRRSFEFGSAATAMIRGPKNYSADPNSHFSSRVFPRDGRTWGFPDFESDDTKKFWELVGALGLFQRRMISSATGMCRL